MTRWGAGGFVEGQPTPRQVIVRLAVGLRDCDGETPWNLVDARGDRESRR
jgi:hypothetical protein